MTFLLTQAGCLCFLAEKALLDARMAASKMRFRDTILLPLK
jgi:hypothetical protein